MSGYDIYKTERLRSTHPTSPIAIASPIKIKPKRQAPVTEHESVTMAEQSLSTRNTQIEDVEEEYLSAQRAAVEAVFVGRGTLEVAVQQGEQLENAEQIADDTQHTLDKAGRMLRGMTWSGWIANMVTRDVGPPPENSAAADKGSSSTTGGPPRVYQNAPESCRGTAQAIQNYHANVTVMEECETEEQKETCRTICDNMYKGAIGQLNLLQDNKQVESYRLEFASHLAVLRKRQENTQRKTRGLGQQAAISSNRASQDRSELLSQSPSKKASPQKADNTILLQKQDAHLDTISQSLGELGSIAHSLHSAIHQQNSTIDSLDSKSETVLEKSKQVTRRADRISQAKSWTPAKPTYSCQVSIRHLESGKYLAVANHDLYLVPKFHPETCIFALWKRQGDVFGLKNKYASRWVGQSLLGSLACSATSFGRREEWQVDEDWKHSRLLCSSAGWGAGGYLHVRPRDHAVVLGGSSVGEAKKAAVFVITDQDVEEEEK